MADKKNTYGVITEQGFVAGQGLGFNEVADEDLNKKSKKNDDKKESGENTITEKKSSK